MKGRHSQWLCRVSFIVRFDNYSCY